MPFLRSTTHRASHGTVHCALLGALAAGALSLSAPLWETQAQQAPVVAGSTAFTTGSGPTCGSALSTAVGTAYAGASATLLPAPIMSIDRMLSAAPAAAVQWRSTNSSKWQATVEGAAGPSNTNCAHLSSVSRGYLQVARIFSRGGVALSIGAHSFSSLDPALDREGVTASMWRAIGDAIVQVDVRTHLTGLVSALEFTTSSSSSLDSLPSDSGWIEIPRTFTVVDTAVRESNRRALDLRTRLHWAYKRLSFDVVVGGTAGTGRKFYPASNDTLAAGNDSRNRAGSVMVRGWGRADVRLTATSFMDITAGLAALPEQPIVGAPARRVATVGVSLGALPRLRSARSPDAPAAAFIEVNRRDSSSVTIRVRIPDAKRVELSGEPTSWKPLVMRKTTGDWWEADLEVAPGSYRVNVRVDGRQWSAPPGTLPTRDEFGGEVGVIQIK